MGFLMQVKTKRKTQHSSNVSIPVESTAPAESMPVETTTDVAIPATAIPALIAETIKITANNDTYDFATYRKKKNLTLQTAAEDLHINPAYLQAIEEHNLAALPERVYTLGFVRSYAQYLGMPVNETVQTFKDEVLLETQAIPGVFPEPLQDTTVPTRKIFFFMGLAALVLVSILIAMFFGKSSSEAHKKEVPATLTMHLPENTPAPLPLSAATPTDVATTALTTPAPVLTPTAEAPVESDHILITFSTPTWVEIKSTSGQIIVNRTFNKNETFRVERQPDLLLFTGNAGAMTLTPAGKEAFPLGKQGKSCTA